MIKVHQPETDQEELIKAASRVIHLVDGTQTIKSAASSAFSEELIRNNMPDDDHFLLHVIAMGDGEMYGQNRNGDWFGKEANQKYHPTFVKRGHFFREHNNRDPKFKIGDIKAAAHNGDMHRVELILHGHKELAEEEYELAKQGKALSFSMACTVPGDRCNVCNNFATKSANYCDHLKHHMNQYIEGSKKFAYAINDDPSFFDMSRVGKPADRIAHYLDYKFGGDEMAKAANVNSWLFSDELAEAYGVVPMEEYGFADNKQKQAILEKMAEAEQFIEDVLLGRDVPQNTKYAFVKHAAPNLFSPEELTDEQLDAIRSVNPGTLFNKLAHKGVMLPFKSFVAYITGQKMAQVLASPTTKKACSLLGGSMRGLLQSALPADMASMFDASSDFMAGSDLGGTDKVQDFMDKAVDKFGIPQGSKDMGRVIHISISTSPAVAKLASNEALDDNMASVYANAYAMYKVSFAQDMAQYNTDFAVDDASTLLLTCRDTI